MKVDVRELEGCKRQLSIEAPLDVVRTAWDAAYGRVSRQARLPGFRKGRVPRDLVKLHFGADVRREVAEQLIPEVYRQALAETRIEPIDEPNLKDVTLEEDAPLTFTAIVEVKPAITLGEYKGLRVEHAPTPVTDEQVDEALSHLRDQHAELRAVDRPVDRGDLVIVDYVLRVEGQAPATETGYAFAVGDGSVLPEIDESVIGMITGGERDVGVRFPEDYRRQELRGKSGTATVKVVEIKEKIRPALDDDFAKTLGEYATLDALRAAVRQHLEAQRDREDRRRLEEKMVDALLARHPLMVPEAMVMRQIAQLVHHARERMRRQGADPDRVQWDYAKIMQELRPGAERAVRRALLLDAIAAAEDLRTSDADVEAEIEKIAAQSQRAPAAVRGMLEKSGDLESLQLRLQEDRALDFLIRHGTITF
jgi:trigger factor